MTKNTSNKKNSSSRKRQASPPSLAGWEEQASTDEEASAEEVDVPLERRSKNINDTWGGSASKAKSQPKKKKRVEPSQRPLKRKNVAVR